MSQLNRRGVHVLVLDAGGVRVFQQIALLRQISNQLPEIPQPYQLFDVIAGSSSGGTLAIILASKCSLDHAQQFFCKLYSLLSPKFNRLSSFCKSKHQKSRQKDLIKYLQAQLPHRELLVSVKKKSSNPTKYSTPFTMAFCSLNDSIPYIFRNFKFPGTSYHSSHKWSCVQAASVMGYFPHFFPNFKRIFFINLIFLSV